MAPATSTSTPEGAQGNAALLQENGQPIPFDAREQPPRPCIDAPGSNIARGAAGPPDVRVLRRRLRNRNSSARFRERQRSRVDELEAQIALFQRENHTLEQLVRELSAQSHAANSMEPGQDWNGASYTPADRRWDSRRPRPPPVLVLLQHTVEVMSDEELLSAIHRGGSSTSSAEEH
ncbi:hypothetical protein FI667_g14800, partial [Globisporangium splendens]